MQTIIIIIIIIIIIVIIIIKVNAKVSLEQATKAQKVSRCIALFYLQPRP